MCLNGRQIKCTYVHKQRKKEGNNWKLDNKTRFVLLIISRYSNNITAEISCKQLFEAHYEQLHVTRKIKKNVTTSSTFKEEQ